MSIVKSLPARPDCEKMHDFGLRLAEEYVGKTNQKHLAAAFARVIDKEAVRTANDPHFARGLLKGIRNGIGQMLTAELSVFELWESMPEKAEWSRPSWAQQCCEKPACYMIGGATEFAVIDVEQKRVLDTHEFPSAWIEKYSWMEPIENTD